MYLYIHAMFHILFRLRLPYRNPETLLIQKQPPYSPRFSASRGELKLAAVFGGSALGQSWGLVGFRVCRALSISLTIRGVGSKFWGLNPKP